MRVASSVDARRAQRFKLAELTSTLGAGVLGCGLGVLFGGYLVGVGVPILLGGVLLHAWGMREKHEIESDEQAPRVWWSAALYWICWLSLAGLALLIWQGS